MPRAFSRAPTSDETIELGCRACRRRAARSPAPRSSADSSASRMPITDSSALEASGLVVRRVLEQLVDLDVEDAGRVLGALEVATDPKERLGDPAQHGSPTARCCCCCCCWLAASAGPGRGRRCRREAREGVRRRALAPRRVARRRAGRRSPSTQVSFEPPPWLEFTTRLPRGARRGSARRGRTQICSPSLIANGRRSTWRGSRRLPTLVGTVESWTTSCAIQDRGVGPDRGRGLASSSSRACGPIEQAVAAGAVDRLQRRARRCERARGRAGRGPRAGRCRRS